MLEEDVRLRSIKMFFIILGILMLCVVGYLIFSKVRYGIKLEDWLDISFLPLVGTFLLFGIVFIIAGVD